MGKKQKIQLPDLELEGISQIGLPEFDIIKKKEFGEEVSKSLEGVTISEEKVDTPDYQLSFQEEKTETVPNYMGLFDKKDKAKQAWESGVSLSFAEQVGEAASKAERPIEFLSKAAHIRKRLDYLKENFFEAYPDLYPIHKQLEEADSRNIDDIEEQLDFVESKIREGETVQDLEGVYFTPEWEKYRSNVIKDPNRLAIQRLQEDNEKLRQAATGRGDFEVSEAISGMPVTGAGAVGKVVGIGESLVEGKGKDLGKGVKRGLKEYAEGYSKLTDELKKNRAITDLSNKLDKINQGEDIELTTEDRILLRAIQENTELHEELDGKIPTAYKIGESLGTSLGFMAEFVATGGVGKAAAVPIWGLKAGTKAGRMGVAAMAKLADAGVQTLAMPAFYKKTAENVSRGMNFAEAALDSYWETGAETLSEKIFMSSPVKAVAGKTGTNMLRRAGINFDADKGAVGVLKNTLEEGAEEKINEILTAPKNYDDFKTFWNDFIDEEKNTVMLGSVALMTGGMGSVALAGNSLAKTKRDAMVKRIEKYIPSDLRAEIDVITENTDLTIKQQYDLIGDAISSRIDAQELGEDPATTTGNAMTYAQIRLQDKGEEATNELKTKEDEDKKAKAEVTEEVRQEPTKEDERKEEVREEEILKEEVKDEEKVREEVEEAQREDEKVKAEKPAEEVKSSEEERAPSEEVKEEVRVEEITPEQKFTEKQEAVDIDKKFTDTKDLSVGDYVAVKSDSGIVYEGFVVKKGRKNMTVQTKSDMYGVQEIQFPIDKTEAFYKPTQPTQKRVEPLSPEKEVITPKEEESALKAAKRDIISETVFTTPKGSKIPVKLYRDLEVSNNYILEFGQRGVNVKSFKNKEEAVGAYDNIIRQYSDKKYKQAEKPQKIKEDGKTKRRKMEDDQANEMERRRVEQEKVTDKEIETVAKKANIRPKNLRDVYKAGREVFGLNRAQALAQAIIVDRIVGKIAKRQAVVKSRVYRGIEFRKSKVEDLGKEARNLYQAVWHGSPYEFDKFRLDKIGTGEGAQAFGWGLYFTDRKGIAEAYANMKKDYGLMYNGNKIEYPSSLNFLVEYPKIDEALLNELQDIGDTKWIDEYNRNPVELLSMAVNIIVNWNRNQINEHISENKDYFGDGKQSINYVSSRLAIKMLDNGIKTLTDRNLYKVKLHGDRAIDDFNYLRWDKKVDKKVYDKIKEYLKDNLPFDYKTLHDTGRYQFSTEDINGKTIVYRYDNGKYLNRMTGKPISKEVFENALKQQFLDVIEGNETQGNSGQILYDNIAESISDVDNQHKEASLFLLRAGIDGIKYPTEITRKGTHEDSFNYVIFDENVAEIEEHIKFQKGQGAKGAIQFLEDGNAIIHALTNPNVSTPLHEIAHLYEKYMTKSERDAVLAWSKHKEWTTETSEKFARGFEKYLAEGKAPNEQLRKVFDRLKQWLTDIYNGIVGSEIDIELNDEMRRVYNSMLGEGTVRPKKAKKVEYKKEFKDVDGLLFQDGALFKGENKTQRHTEAINKLIDNFEREDAKNMEKSVRDYLEERGNPVSEEIINNTLKQRGYAEEQPSRKVREKTKPKERESKRDKDLPKRDKTGVQKKEVEVKKGEKPKQFGVKVTESTKLSPSIKKSVKEQGIGYIPRGAKVTEAEAKELIRIYSEEGGLDRVKEQIRDRDNKIKGDTRVAMAVAYVDRVLKMADLETDVNKVQQLRQDAIDVFNDYVREVTGVAQELQAQRMWDKVLGVRPEFATERARAEAEKNNKEFYEKYKDDIDYAQGVIDKFIKSKEFQEKYQRRVQRKNKQQKVEEGKAKVAEGLDRLASLMNIKKNAVADNNIDDNAFDAIKQIADGILDIGVANAADLVNSIKTQVRKYFTPSEVDNITKRLLKETDAVNRFQKTTRKITLDKKTEEELVDKLYAEMNIATKKQLRQLLADNMELFQKEGAINDRSFRELFAKALGKDYVSNEEIQAIEDAARVVNDANTIAENIDVLFDEYIKASKEEDKSRANKLRKEVRTQLKEYRKALRKAGEASKEINKVFAESPTTVKMLANFIQGNLLTPASLRVNMVANLAVAPIRMAKNILASNLDFLLSEIGKIRKSMEKKHGSLTRKPFMRDVLDQMLAEERTFMSSGVNRGLFRGAIQGTREGVEQMWYGQTSEDLYRRDLTKAIHPFEAWYENYKMLKGDEKLRVTKMINNFIEGTLGVPPEIMFRLLNLGDKPPRRAAEQSRLEEIANIKKLKGAEREAFLARPDDASWEQARQAGMNAVYQQDNFISDYIKKLGSDIGKKTKTDLDALDKITSSIRRLAFVATMPFVKTPTNILIETLEYTLPPIPLAKAFWHAAKGNRREFVDNIAKVITGMAINTAVGALFGTGALGLASGGEEEEPKMAGAPERVRAGEYLHKPPYYLNERVLQDVMRNVVYGENNNLEWRKGDKISSYTRYGLPSSILMAHAQAYRGLTDEEIKDMNFFRRQLLFTLPVLRSGLDQSFVTGISSGFNAIMGGQYEQERYLTNMARAMSATAIPGTYRSYVQAKDNIIRENVDKSFKDFDRMKQTIKNTMRSSYVLDNGVASKVTAWGDRVDRYKDGKHPLFRIFDITKDRTYGSEWSVDLWELYEDTKDQKALPPIVDEKVRVLDKDVKTGGDLYERMATYVGSNNKITAKAAIESDEFKTADDFVKLAVMDRVYKQRAVLRNQFVRDNKEEFYELYKKQHGKKAFDDVMLKVEVTEE